MAPYQTTLDRVRCLHCEQWGIPLMKTPQWQYVCGICEARIEAGDGHAITQIAERIGCELMEFDWPADGISLSALKLIRGLIKWHVKQALHRTGQPPEDEAPF